MEVLVYQTYLLSKAKNGGGLECVEGDDHLDNAIMIVDSLWRMTQLGPLEDITKYLELPFYTVESYNIDGREYLIANGIHLIDSKHELRADDQVVVLDTEDEKYPKTINGFRVNRVANPSNFIVAIKA